MTTLSAFNPYVFVADFDVFEDLPVLVELVEFCVTFWVIEFDWLVDVFVDD